MKHLTLISKENDHFGVHLLGHSDSLWVRSQKAMPSIESANKPHILDNQFVKFKKPAQTPTKSNLNIQEIWPVPLIIKVDAVTAKITSIR